MNSSNPRVEVVASGEQYPIGIVWARSRPAAQRRSASLPSTSLLLYVLLPFSDAATAQHGEAAEETLDELVVIGKTVGELNLDAEAETGSRLGLSLRQTPASVDILDSAVMDSRGYQQLSDAVSSLSGVSSGQNPTAPSSFAIRGFSGQQITVLRDGIWLGPSSMVMRPQNTFNLERVELLRGPASVINGVGAVAGTVNAIMKTAERVDEPRWQALASVGEFDTYHVGLGVQGAASDSAWYRFDISQNGSDGYVDGSDPESLNLSGSLLWALTESVELKLSADYLDDELMKYFGTPLLPAGDAVAPMNDAISTTTGETIDNATKFVNYNVSDGTAESDQLLLRADLRWTISDELVLRNTLYSFDAERHWKNAEGYVYCTEVVDVCTSVGDISRYYGYFLLFHDQELLGNRLTLSANGMLGGMENRAIIGLELSDLDFVRTRGFRRSVPATPADIVDRFNPVAGVYGPEELRGISPTEIQTRAVFVEDSLLVADSVRIVGGLRYEELDLDRVNLDADGVDEGSGFARDFDWWSYRLGVVFDLSDDVAVYGQFTNAKDPINANVFLVSANEDFDLTDAEQWEVGAKASLGEGFGEMTFAYFDIARDDILERYSLDSATNVGGRDSRGFELSGSFQPTDQWQIGANAAYVDAAFKRSANFEQFAGNSPPNIADVTANLWTSLRDIGGTPFELGGSVRYVGDRFANNANRITLKAYTLADVYLAWNSERFRITARVDNVTDEDYVEWSDRFYLGNNDPSFIYANQLLLGAPRTWSLLIQTAF